MGRKFGVCVEVDESGGCLTVAFAHHEVEGAENGRNVGNQVAFHQFRQDGWTGCRRRGSACAGGWEARPPSECQEETQLSLRVFRGKVNLPGRGVHPHGRRHELANQGFHVRQDFFLFRQRAFGVHHVDGAVRHGFNDLADDAQGLAHFFNAHGKTVVAVSVFAYGDVEIRNFHIPDRG